MKPPWNERIGRTPWRGERRVSDAGMPLRRARAFKRGRRERGFSIIELLAAFAIFGVLVAVAAPSIQRRPYALWEARTMLLGDLRRTRSNALIKGDHFRLDVLTDHSYTVSRMQLGVGGVWTPIVPPIISRTLPPNVAFTSGVGNGFEFNTRGLMVNPSWAQTLNLYDADRDLNKWVTVYPSGQVAPG
jgi:prepilin-type N-terminal cleavage/methylation domain-containing protein